MPDIRLIGIDLDGTLITDRGVVPQANVAAIHQALERGITVAVVTGRPHVSAQQFALALGLRGVPVISFNGAQIRLPGEPEPMFTAPVPAALAAQVVDYCVDTRLHLHYYLDDDMFVPQVSKWARLYYARTGIAPLPVGDLRRFEGREPIKLLACTDPDDVPRVLEEGRERWGEDLIVTRSMPEYVEFLSAAAGKGKALHWLAEHLGIGTDQTMGMGDMLNDLELIEMAGVGVAMAQAQDEVKAAADYVTTSQAEGVAEAIEKFCLS